MTSNLVITAVLASLVGLIPGCSDCPRGTISSPGSKTCIEKNWPEIGYQMLPLSSTGDPPGTVFARDKNGVKYTVTTLPLPPENTNGYRVNKVEVPEYASTNTREATSRTAFSLLSANADVGGGFSSTISFNLRLDDVEQEDLDLEYFKPFIPQLEKLIADAQQSICEDCEFYIVAGAIRAKGVRLSFSTKSEAEAHVAIQFLEYVSTDNKIKVTKDKATLLERSFDDPRRIFIKPKPFRIRAGAGGSGLFISDEIVKEPLNVVSVKEKVG